MAALRQPGSGVRELPPIEEEVDYASHLVGEIADVDEEGRAHVTFPGNRAVPVPARSAISAPGRKGARPDALVGAPVLLVFENADPGRPIVVGLLGDRLQPEPELPEVALELGKARDVVVDGERLVFDAKQEIELRCGRSYVVLTRTGKVLIRGVQVTSRASGTNKIKGGAVRIN